MWPFRSRAVEERSTLSVADPAVAMLLGFGDATGFPVISEQAALNLSAVWRAVSLISGTIASLPLRTLQDDPQGARQRVPSFLDNPAGPGRMTPYEWKELVFAHLLLRGNSYLQHLRNGAGAMTGLWPIHPASVEVAADAGAVGGKRFTVALDNGKQREFDGADMSHIYGLSLDGLVGLSPITVARTSLGTGLAGDKAAAKMFQNGAMVSGLVTPDDDLDSDEALQIKRDLTAKMSGPDKAGDIAVVNRRLKFQQWSLSAEDAQFLQSRAFQIEEVARWFGLPPHLLAQTDKQTSWGTGVAEQNRGLARYTLTPWTTRMEQRLTRVLPTTKLAEFDYTAFVKPSPEVEIPLLIQQVNGGLLTVNEARRVRNLPPVDGGDVLRSPQAAPPAGAQDGGPA